jgi:hypothetical protein
LSKLFRFFSSQNDRLSFIRPGWDSLDSNHRHDTADILSILPDLEIGCPVR